MCENFKTLVMHLQYISEYYNDDDYSNEVNFSTCLRTAVNRKTWTTNSWPASRWLARLVRMITNTLYWKMNNYQCACRIPKKFPESPIWKKKQLFTTRRVKCVLYALRAKNSLRILRSSWRKLVYAPRE